MSSTRPTPVPRIPRDRILVAVTEDAERDLGLAIEYEVGAEVQTFAFPTALANVSGDALEWMAKQTAGLRGPIGCHGAFLDTCHYSLDPEIRKVSRMRYLQSMDVAARLGARYVVFHSQYNPVIRVPTYPDIYQSNGLEFWPDMIAEAERRGLAVYVENMFDDSPEPIRRLMSAVNSPRFKACLDVAHAAIWSQRDMAEWIEALKPHLRHVHLTDCRGVQDDHLGLGQGDLDLPRFLHMLEDTGLPLTYAIETGENTPASLRYLGLDKTSC